MNKELDWPRIAHLMKIGIIAALMVLAFSGLPAMMKKAKGGSGNEEQETK